MSVVLPLARWTTKPLPGTDLDRLHPFCPDHAWPFLSPQGTAQPLTKAAPLLAPSTRGDIYAGSSAIVRGNKYGLSVRHAGTSDTTRLTADLAAEVDKVVPNSGGHTVLLAYRKLDTTLRNCSVFGNNTSTGNEWYGVHGLPWQDGNVYWRFGQQTEGIGQLTITAATLTSLGVTFGDDLWVFTSGPRGMEIYWNGRLLASNTGNSTRTTSAAAKPLLFPSFTPVNSDLADIGLFMTWRRQLPGAAVRSLSINPWQVFQSPSTIVFPRVAEPPGTYPSGPYVSVIHPRWVQKPIPGTDLDRTHPHCPDHCWPLLSPQGTAQCLAKAASLAAPTTRGDIYTGSSAIVPGRKYGLSVRHSNTDPFMRLTADDTNEVLKVLPSSGGMTWMFAYRKLDTTARASATFGVQSGDSTPYSERFSIFLPYNSPNNIYFYFGGNTEGVNQLSVAASGITFGDDFWCFTTGPRGMEIWQNGLLRGSNTANPTRATAAGERLALPAYTTANGSDLADIALVMTWRRQLHPNVIRALAINPWQVFQPQISLVRSFGLVTAAPPPPAVTFPALILAP